MKRFITIITALLITLALTAQSELNSDTYFENALYNTSKILDHNDYRITFLTAGNFKFSEETALFNLMASKQISTGAIGLKAMHYDQGLFQQTKFEGLYAYEVNVNEDMNLGFGLNAGFVRINTSTQMINDEVEAGDMVIENIENSNNFTAGFGFNFNYKNLNVGLSSPDLANTNKGFVGNGFVDASYLWEANDDFDIVPNVLYYDGTFLTNGIFQAGVSASYQKSIGAQFNYATNKSFTAGLGYKYKSIELGYAYQWFNGTSFTELFTSKHLIMLRLQPQKSNAQVHRVEDKLEE